MSASIACAVRTKSYSIPLAWTKIDSAIVTVSTYAPEIGKESMKRGLVILVAVIIAFVLAFLLMRSSHKNDEPRKVQYVIGQEAAKAAEAERRRKAAGNTGKSPMPDMKYDFWRGEKDLIKPAQNTLDRKIVELCKNFASSDAATRAKMRSSGQMSTLTFDRLRSLPD